MSIASANNQPHPAAWQTATLGLALFCALALPALLPLSASAADCKKIAEEAGRERDLIARRDLLAKALEQCPKDPEINFMLAYSLERLRAYKEAQRYYISASTLDPKHAKAFFGLGDISMLTNKAQDAVAAYEKGLALDPGNKRAAKPLESARIKLEAQRREKEAVSVLLLKEKTKNREVSPSEATILRLLILFPDKATELPEESADQLSIVGARAFTSQDLQEAVFEVVGHTDDSGDAKTNLDVSLKRAEAVRTYLIMNHNIEAKKLKVAAKGHTQPIVPNSTELNKMINNRVEFRRLK